MFHSKCAQSLYMYASYEQQFVFAIIKLGQIYLLSCCKFWIYWVGVNTKFTIWQLSSKFKIYKTLHFDTENKWMKLIEKSLSSDEKLHKQFSRKNPLCQIWTQYHWSICFHLFSQFPNYVLLEECMVIFLMMFCRYCKVNDIITLCHLYINNIYVKFALFLFNVSFILLRHQENNICLLIYNIITMLNNTKYIRFYIVFI